MNIGAAALGVSTLLNLLGNPKQDRPTPADLFAPEGASPADSSASTGQALPAPSTGGISFDMMLALQSISQQRDERANAPIEETQRSDAVHAFLDESQKTPMERMREQILHSLGLTEDDLNNMTTDERQAAEAKISELIQEKLRQGMTGEGASGEAQGVGRFMVEVA